MIPKVYITEWRQSAPWLQDIQVEQDLLLSRVLVELFNHPKIVNSLAFRGGTALYKLFINPPARYSEDLDFVQINSEPIGKIFDAVKETLYPLLGEPKWKLGNGRATLFYKFQAETVSSLTSKIKIEINTREHFSVHGYQLKNFSVNTRWFSGEAKIPSYHLNELMGTKMRALYQRKKGRDLFDLWIALKQKDFDSSQTVLAFVEYMKKEDKYISRSIFEKNLLEKLQSDFFANDITPLLSPSNEWKWDMRVAAEEIQDNVICLLSD
jgi:predicted nucleotidyltransferase component of viral defense system